MDAISPRPQDRVVVIGAGIAGLATALKLAPLPVLLLSAAPVGAEAATGWAQGGIAAALGPDDEPSLHAADTLAAAAGLGAPEVARRVAEAAPGCIAWLAGLGAPFDRTEDGRFALGLEAAHSRRRIVHAGGDGTGAAVLRSLARAVEAESRITVRHARATALLRDEAGIAGVLARQDGASIAIPARVVVLATGGIGGLYAHTTNPLGAAGTGLALAARAGAVLRDLEFVQFHPTAIAVGRDPMPLATEALRGEGAVLVTAAGERVMADHPQGDLAPRDVIARAVWRRVASGEAVFLDARSLGDRLERFARVTALCREDGLDPARQPIPIRPAAHYHMGGVAVDGSGRTSVPGLWAAGEVAATGLHGANRLASNSLLEALAYAGWMAEDIRNETTRPPLRPLPLGSANRPTPDAGIVAGLRALMERHVGVVRDGAGLVAAIAALRPLADAAPSALSDRALAGLLIATAALRRRESRGAQCRSDVPEADPASAPSFLTLADVLEGDAPRAGVARP
ncbi:L-aspartate oxidase [Inquilinus limosus]|uniref:L-aspartate oxidase n=1 Tax=Inquilinus limosus TaxID=171674 RepID=UPI003F14C47E